MTFLPPFPVYPIIGGATAPPSTIKYPFLHRALAQVAGGVQDRKLLLVGDSIIGGDFVSQLTGQGPAVELAKYLSGLGINSSADGLSGAQPNTAGGFVNDPRWTAGTGWSLPSTGTGNAGAHNSWAGEGSAWFAATGTAGTLAFKPSAGFYDHADIYYVNVGGTSGFSVNFNGGSDNVQSQSSTGVFKATVSGSSTARPNINMHAVTGTIGCWIIGVECYLSTTPTLRIGNVGMGGATSGGWIDSASAVGCSPLACLTAYAPDTVVYSIGVNDANASVPPATFATNVATFIAQMHALTGGCDVVIMTDNPCTPAFGGSAFANQAAIAAQFLATGAANGCPTLDIFDAWGAAAGSATMNTDGYYADAVVHPSIQGQSDQGRVLGAALLAA